MSKPIYQMYMAKGTEAAYQLGREGWEKLNAKNLESLASVGAEMIINCDSIWSSEPWLFFGINKFPDIEAVQKHAANLVQIEWYRYVEGKTLLGTESEV